MSCEQIVQPSREKTDIKSLTLEELSGQLKELGCPAFRGGQVYRWLHQRRASDFSQMSDLSLQLRSQLAERYYINVVQVEKKLVSAIDGTQKFLYRLMDGECVEGVLMEYHHGNSLCISTQVGCRMGCRFCASTLTGLARNLTPSEMLDEVYAAEEATGKTVNSLVLMGIGEPLDNFDNVLRFLELLSSPEGKNLSLRHVSLSTCGLVDRIYQLMEKKLQLTLSISLHAPNDRIREQTMPVNRRWNMEQLLKACRDYFRATSRRISFEYALIQGVNDSPEAARELAERLRGMPAHVNLIPVNAVRERGYRRSSGEQIRRFVEILENNGVNATVRRELGSDINAACGQLRRESRRSAGQNGGA